MENNEMLEEKVLSNGDLYYGDFKGMLPHGKGRYTWANNKAVYEGEWELGKMTGKGKIFWESGARYEGDISGGYLHGCGTFTKPDGSVYTGDWRMNIQHGVGRKEYGNSDVYEGMWKEGVREGSGRYMWNSGHTYVGNWKGGKMWGRGIMKWVNGDLYDGSWLNGLRHESGIYRFADGAYYFGTWNSGLKEGKGTYYPAGSKHPSLKKWCSMGYNDKGKNLPSHSLSLAFEESRAPKTFINRSYSEKVSMGGVLRNSGRISSRAMSLDENWSVFYSEGELGSQESSFEVPEVPEERQDKMQDDSSLIYEREYMQGVLIKERTRNYQELTCKTEQKNKFHGKESKKRPCMDMPLRDRSYYLKLNLQLGIRYTVGKITPVPRREVRYSDFGDRARIRMYFPRKGSQFTPPHYSIDFYWKDYCPMVFRNLREMFKLDAAEYMMSICGDDGLTEISSPGKSGSIFYNSHDSRFVIKTLKKSELKVLLKMLPDYYNHVGEHENTLITKFFGLHRIKLKGGRKVRFVVMGNMFCTELQIHRRYDLKGSSLGRFTDKEKIHQNTTLKDLDLAYEFHMDKFLREAFFKQISLDCMFLESQQIIDYSLLLGLHFRAPEQLKALFNGGAAMVNEESSSTANGPTSRGELLIPPKGLLLVTHEPSSVSTTPGPHIRGSTLRAFSLGDKEVDLLLPGTARIVFMPTEWLHWQSRGLIAKVLGFWHRLRVQLGVNMPAQANRKLREDGVDSAEIELFEVYDVVLYMGIIDILQDYSLKKKIEHAYKSLWYDPLSISVIEPKLYAKRFISFLERVFPANTEGYQ